MCKINRFKIQSVFLLQELSDQAKVYFTASQKRNFFQKITQKR